MKWKLIKLFLPVCVLVFVMPMIMPGPKGMPIMTINDWLPSSASIHRLRSDLLSWWHRISTGIEQNTGLDVAPAPEQLFKWKDANGNWHFTNRADQAAAGAQQQTLPTATNTMAPPPVVKRDDDSETGSTPSMPLPLPATIPVDKIPQLIDDAKKLQKLSQDRAEQMDDL